LTPFQKKRGSAKVCARTEKEKLMSDGNEIHLREGRPQSGAQWDGKGTNFGLFSANATKVEVCIFDATGSKEVERVSLPEYTDQIWHGYLENVTPGTIVVKAHGRQMDLKTRKKWRAELSRYRTKSLDGPSWLWTSVVELVASHEAAY
jgi:pullulanase/glycogen debranching enzyme